MRSKLLLFLFSAAVALSVGTVAQAGDRDHRDSRDRDRRESRDNDHRERQVSHRDDRGRNRDHNRGYSDHHSRSRHYYHDRGRSWDRHGHRVWSHAQPRVRFYVGHRPPPMRHEYRSHRPSSRHYWVPGCWSWRAGYTNWVWVGGYWDLPPYENYVYVAPRYLEEDGRVVYVDGGWSEPTYAHDGEANGAVLGAVAGGIIGHQSHNTGAGVVVGAVVGSIIGREADKEDAQRRAAAQQRVVYQSTRSTPTRSMEPVDPELAAAQERARVAKARLAEARQARGTADARAAALKQANDEAAAAEAELETVNE